MHIQYNLGMVQIYTRLPFGIKTAGDIFIQEINELLKYLPGVDILVHGSNIQEHNTRLELLLQRARKVDSKLNPKKYAKLKYHM